jgi:hypothetical protein
MLANCDSNAPFLEEQKYFWPSNSKKEEKKKGERKKGRKE